MNPPFRSSRRRFLQTSSAALFAAPWVTTGVRAVSPNGKLRHASFGGSGMAMSDMRSLSNHEKWELVAVCDVDSRHFPEVKKLWPQVKTYSDWREMLEKEGDNIDSVNVSTPDHMHGPIGLAAMAKGKHVYGQKPLTQNLWECRQAMLRAREKGVMTQMGIQVSSMFTERHAVAIIQSDAIGKIKEVHTFSNKKWGDLDPRPADNDTPPPEFNWDLWLGVAAERPFIDNPKHPKYYHPSNWRKRRDFGTGTLGDMGCHMFSGWFRALDLASTSIQAIKSTGPAPNEHNWAINAQVEYTYGKTAYTAADTVKVTWYDGDAQPPADVIAAAGGKYPGQGSIYIGTDGVLLAAHMQTPMLYPREKFTGFTYPKLDPRDHYKEFVDCCINGGAKPSANFDYSSPLTEAVLLGCLCSAFPNETLQWDAPGLKFTNSDAANKLVRRDYRKGWEVV